MLIGPALFPIFRLVTTIVLLVLVGVWVFGVVVDVGMNQRPLTNPAALVGGLVGSLFQTFGTIVLIFALIETFTHGKIEAEAKQQPWNPRTLVQDRSRASASRSVSWWSASPSAWQRSWSSTPTRSGFRPS
jgi:hypothetical protein